MTVTLTCDFLAAWSGLREFVNGFELDFDYADDTLFHFFVVSHTVY